MKKEMKECCAENIILLCEDSFEGIFTGIYEAYALRIPHERIGLQIGQDGTPMLFTTYREIAPDRIKAEKVTRTLRQRFGEEDYRVLCMALASASLDKAQAVYKTVVWGLSSQRKGSMLGHLSDDNVRRVMELNRGTGNELCHLRGFLRFEELENGILSAVIKPRDNILPMLASHFADRLPQENFIICDEGRALYAIHPAGKDFLLMSGCEDSARRGGDTLGFSDAEMYYRELFKHFCHTISIKERENLKLQRNMLPLRFRPYMTEFF